MPLKDGCGSDIRASNIREMVAAGYPQKQAVAAALDHQRKQGCSLTKLSAEEEQALEEHLGPDEVVSLSAFYDRVEFGPAIIAIGDDLAYFASVYVPGKTRKRLASKGVAMPDGSFPIPNKEFLRRAIQSFGRAKAQKKAAVKAHIKRRAKALGASSMLPVNWGSDA